jgi:hypothetical protein
MKKNIKHACLFFLYSLFRKTLLIISLFSLFSIAVHAAPGKYSPEAREYHLKAAFLRYVAKFIEWPTTSVPGDKINICVLGQVPYFEGINSINGKVIDNRTLVVKKLLNITDAKDACQILFVTKTEIDSISSIIDAVDTLPILSFGDMDKFAQEGGNMNFYIANNRLAIAANLSSIDKAQLKVNPEMLRLITIIPPSEKSKI